MKLRTYATAVTGLAASILTADLMMALTNKDVLEIAIVTSVVASISTLFVLLESEPKKRAKQKIRRPEQETTKRYIPRYCPIVTLDPKDWEGGKTA